MAAPSLKHYSVATTVSVTAPVGTAPAAGRALVVSKVTLTNIGSVTATGIYLYAGTEVGANAIVAGLALAVGETYAETGVVLAAGEQFRAFGAGAALAVNVFGQEVDN